MNYKFKINNNFYLIFIIIGLPISVLLKEYNLSILPNFDLALVKIYRILLVLFTIYLLIKLKNTLNYYVLLLLIINLLFLYNQFFGTELVFNKNLAISLEENTDLQRVENEKISFTITQNKFLIINIFNIILPLILFSFKKFSINVHNFNIIIFKILKIYLLFFLILYFIKLFTLEIPSDIFNLVSTDKTSWIYQNILFFNFKFTYQNDFQGFFINAHSIFLPLSLFFLLLLQNFFNEQNKNNLFYMLIILIILLLNKAYLMLFISLIIGIMIMLPYITKNKLLFVIICFFTFFIILLYFQNFNINTGSILSSIIIRFNIGQFYLFNLINPNYLIGNNILVSNLYTYPHNFIIDLYICTGFFGCGVAVVVFNKIYNSFKFNNFNFLYFNIILFHSLFVSLLSGFFFTNIALNILLAFFLIKDGERA